MTSPLLRHIKSFVLRQGRITPAQEKACSSLMPLYGIDIRSRSFSDYFDASHTSVNLEIGFGMGDALFNLASLYPNQEWLGIEVHTPGVGRALQLIHEGKLKNVHLVQEDALFVLKTFIPDESLSRVCLFFPDPWPKKKHHKRRILQPDFVELIAQKLKPGGLFHLATDWENYAEHMKLTLDRSPSFHNEEKNDRADRPFTKFEKRGLKLGHHITDLRYLKKIRPHS